MKNGADPPLPFSDSGERGLLCSLLLEPGKVHKICAEVLPPEAFYVPANQMIYEAITEWTRPELSVDHVWLFDKLRKAGHLEEVGGKEYVAPLYTYVPCADNAEHYAGLVLEAYSRRQAILLSREIQAAMFDPMNGCLPSLEDFERRIHKLHVRAQGNQLPITPISLDMLSKNIPPIVIDGILYQGGKMVISAPSKAFKTWLILELIFCVANGFDWWNRKTRQGRVLLLNFELPDWDIRRRFERIREAYNGGSFANIRIVHLRGRNFKLFDLETLAERLRGENFSLIVIDPVYKLLAGLNENDTGDIITFCNAAEAFAAALSASIAMTHHFAKGNASSKDPLDRASGSGVWARDPDSLLTLTPNETEDCFTVNATLRSFPPIDQFVVRWSFPVYTSAIEIDPEKLKNTGAGRPAKYNVQSIVDLLDSDEPCSLQHLKERAARIIKCSDRTFKRLLFDALERKAIFKDANECYQINVFR
jgi:hypothetical protein